MTLVHWPLMGGLMLHLVQRGGDWAGSQPAQAHRAVPNVTAHPRLRCVEWDVKPYYTTPYKTAHPSAASVPITVLLYNGPLLCGFDVPIKGLIRSDLSSE